MAKENTSYSLMKNEYYVTAVLSDGRLLHLENVAENIAWEENKSEIAVRLNLTIRDVQIEKDRVSKLLKLCTVVYLYAKWDGENKKKEIFRGTIWEWEHSQTNSDAVIITCYDMLYYLSKSNDNKYFAAGKSSKDICTSILNDWKVPISEYSGPSISHKKIAYKNKTISSMLTETLDEVKKKTGKKAVIQAVEGKCRIIARGTNKTIWSFTANSNLVSMSDKFSMVNLVTRIVITGKEDDDEKTKVEATVEGDTQYGVFQQIKNLGSLSIAEAKQEAQETINEKGKPQRTITLVAPDIPSVRKGDMIHAKNDSLKGYFYVEGVSHNATGGSMQMEVEPI